jgi:uncharacterized GH25 family protein
MTNLRIAATLLLTIALAASSLAHDTWLIPDRFVVARDTLVLLDLTSGMAFPALETSIKPERLERALCRVAGHTFEVTAFSPASKSLRFKARLVEPGVATFWVELKPRSLQLTADKVQEYIDEIDAPRAIREAWANARRPRRWREVYTKHSKTFVRVGELPSPRSWAEPVGMRLEIVPERDPTALRVGDEFPVRVFKDGAPMAGFPLGIVFEGSSKGRIEKTNAEGRVTFRLDRKGRCLLRGTDLRKASQAGVDWESDFTTMTIRIGD